MDLFSAADDYEYEQEQKRTVQAPLTVEELSQTLKATLQECFGTIQVVGEIGSLARPGSGHIYLKLKDQSTPSLIDAVIWKGTASRITHVPEDGQLVVATGQLTTYAPRSSYQLTIQNLQLAGQGALLQLLEQRKAKLAAEGLFDSDRKQQIPYIPNTIGIVTSPTGAVIEDMLHRLTDRCPRNVILAPTRVQGEGAAAEIATAITALNNLPKAEKPSVIIVARGGGSLEDLWAFNEEAVVYAIANSTIPIISGVGHEPDVTLCDLVADLRAPTPTAAIEFAVPVRTDVLNGLKTMERDLTRAFTQKLQFHQQRLDLVQAKFPKAKHVFTPLHQTLDGYEQNLKLAINNILQTQKNHLQVLEKTLPALAPLAPLNRGFAMVKDEDGKIITSAKTQAKSINLQFKDGTRHASLHPHS